MIPTELKIIITSIILWLVAHCAAFPSTPFADWGEKKFGSYGNFIGALIFIFAIPIVVTGLYWLWSL
jgi:hypothetical protein